MTSHLENHAYRYNFNLSVCQMEEILRQFRENNNSQNKIITYYKEKKVLVYHKQ